MAGVWNPEVVKTPEEINDMITDCIDTNGTLHGMTFEEGVRAGIEWVIGEMDENPLD